jgi:hypothetical protein
MDKDLKLLADLIDKLHLENVRLTLENAKLLELVKDLSEELGIEDDEEPWPDEDKGPLSDYDLGRALSWVNAKLMDKPRIQALIGEYVERDQSFTAIPFGRRAEFLEKLYALGTM